MFDIGFGEMLLLAAIALIALGPKQLPEVARTIGRFMNQVKRATNDFQRTLAEVGDSTNSHFDSAKKALEKEIIPSNYLHGPTGGHVGMPTDDHQPSLPMNGGDPHAGGREAHAAAMADDQKSGDPQADAGDEHKQMSFDIDKKES